MFSKIWVLGQLGKKYDIFVFFKGEYKGWRGDFHLGEKYDFGRKSVVQKYQFLDNTPEYIIIGHVCVICII